MVDTKEILKEKLFAKIEPLQTRKKGAPLTDKKLDATLVKEIEQLTESLEAVNPTLSPLLYKPQLVSGIIRGDSTVMFSMVTLDNKPKES